MKSLNCLFATILLSLEALAQTPRITFTAPMLYPEGVAVHPTKDVFYLSSVKTGTISAVDNTGVYKVLYEDKDLKSTFGMKVDPKTNQLWVCAGDPNYSKYSTPATFQKMARLVSIDITTGKKTKDIDLGGLTPGKHFANDLAFDQKGNMYVTDSFAPIIYKVDAQGKASVFVQSDFFKGEDVGLNGIVYHPQGFLLVANQREGALYKVDEKDPKKITKVKTDIFFPGIDGLLLDEQNNLVLIQNKGINKASQLTSTDGWQSAKVMATTAMVDRFQHPTTGALQKGKIYLLNSKMNELTDSSQTPSKEFSLQLVQFKPAQ